MKSSLSEELKERVIEFVKNSPVPVCIGDVGRHLGVSWATARYAVMLLALEGRVEVEKTSKGWIPKPKPEQDLDSKPPGRGKGGVEIEGQ